MALLCGLAVFPLPSPAQGQETIRIMPLGDSITEGKDGDATYRYFLWHHFQDQGLGVDFVGSKNGVRGDGLPKYADFDQDHEGHSGWTAEKMAQWADNFAQHAHPDIVLVHLGTNDVLRGRVNTSTRDYLETIIGHLRVANPQVIILIAEIIPIAGKTSQVQDLNVMIRNLASETTTTNSPVIAVDQYTGFNINTDLYDGVHPSESGYEKMADRWYAAVAAALGGEVPSPTVVALTEPSAGASFPSGSSISLSASVTGDQPVAKVVFLADGVAVGEDATSPYEISWSGASDGPVALRADAYEQGGVVVSSPSVSVTVGSPQGSPEVLLVVGNPATIGVGDARVIERLGLLGFSVVVLDDDGITAGAASGKVLVMISASVTPGRIGTTFTGTPVPLITWEGGVFDDLGLTGSTSGVDFGESDKRKTLAITASAHPLAAGLSGTVIVSDPASRFMWGLPAASAALVATLENDPAKYVVFGYESGASMVSGSAPARRVGLFLHDTTASILTEAGRSILDAAVLWATGGEVPSPTVVALTEPSAGASFPSGSSISLSASVTGDQPVAKVVFLADGVAVGEDATSPYEISWSGASDGPVALRADAYEQGGVVVSSPSVSVTVGSPQGSPEVLLVVGNPATIGVGDARVIERLGLLGFSVVVLDDDGITAGAASGKVLVMISASVTPGRIGTTFTGTPVPLITWEGGVFDDLGLTGSTSGVDFGESDKRKTLAITASAHPLAAGLSGTVIVSDPASRFMWGLPAASAALVATLENDPAKYVVFGYESGASMVSGSAPARRVGLFLHDTTASILTEAGRSILDAAVLWATGGPG